MGLLDRNPVLKRAIVNQYQAILATGAVAFSVLLANPLPLLLFAGGAADGDAVPARTAEAPDGDREEELRAAVRGDERRAALRRAAAGDAPALRAAAPALRPGPAELPRPLPGLPGRPRRPDREVRRGARQRPAAALAAAEVRRALAHLQRPAGQGRDRQDPAGARVARRWMRASARPGGRTSRSRRSCSPRSTATSRRCRRSLAELDSLETLLQLLLQKSLAATDAGAFALEIDDVVSQAEADAASVVELERLLGGIPELAERPDLGDLAPPAPQRSRQGGFRRG